MTPNYEIKQIKTAISSRADVAVEDLNGLIGFFMFMESASEDLSKDIVRTLTQRYGNMEA